MALVLTYKTFTLLIYVALGELSADQSQDFQPEGIS